MPSTPGQSTPAGTSRGVFTFRAGRALVLGVFAMGAVAWIVTLPGVLIAALCAGAAAALTSHAARIRTLLIATTCVALAAAFAGSLLLGHGSSTIRLLGGLVASLAVAPWAVVLGIVLRARTVRADG